MNLKDLKNIDINDLKNIDINQVKDSLLSKPSILIKILLIIAAIFATIHVNNVNRQKKEDYAAQLKKNEEKLAASQRLTSSEKKFDKFINEFPVTLSSNDLVNQLAIFASKHDVEVVSFSPVKNIDYGYMDLTTIDIDISSTDYVNINAFVKDIDQSAYAIRIDQLIAKKANSGSDYRNLQDTKEEDKIEAKITISAIQLNRNIK